ncbi:hypothetical protein CDAR_195261 [Caerostris darwini]|uniref:Uncharacterized protein n=1 Tax=Caerostris darwini TaxID=1538125 RepID=A0AAV4R410_9ARAC|nr:hypothetical protein CDAR_195261 [Caerostris darwini]
MGSWAWPAKWDKKQQTEEWRSSLERPRLCIVDSDRDHACKVESLFIVGNLKLFSSAGISGTTTPVLHNKRKFEIHKNMFLFFRLLQIASMSHLKYNSNLQCSGFST